MTNSNDGFDNGRTSIFRLDDNSVLKSDEFTFLYGADVILFENSELLLGKIVF
ncbi:MAG: hypothetical protein MJ094_00240 [Saccharofermentans sp.]|nr:hypothetical protein [Saccharofermentans sp.]